MKQVRRAESPNITIVLRFLYELCCGPAAICRTASYFKFQISNISYPSEPSRLSISTQYEVRGPWGYRTAVQQYDTAVSAQCTCGGQFAAEQTNKQRAVVENCQHASIRGSTPDTSKYYVLILLCRCVGTVQ